MCALNLYLASFLSKGCLLESFNLPYFIHCFLLLGLAQQSPEEAISASTWRECDRKNKNKCPQDERQGSLSVEGIDRFGIICTAIDWLFGCLEFNDRV